MSKISTIFGAFLIAASASAAEELRPKVQSLAEVAAKTDETAVLLAKKMMAHGSFQRLPDGRNEQLLSLLNATVNKADTQTLPQRLILAGAFNGSGGGGGIACFRTAEETAAALDPAGRLDRSLLSHIRDFDNFDTFRVVHGDDRRWADALQGKFHLRVPNPGEDAEHFLRRVLYQNVLAYFPLLVERLMTIMVRYPFKTWQPVSGIGLPFYPDLDHHLFKDLRRKENTCVYSQLAIRMVKDSGSEVEQVQYFYDKDLLARLHELATSEQEYQRWLATVILHEDSYLLARELGAENADDVHKVIEMVLFEDADIDQMKLSFFEPGMPNRNRLDQSVGLLFEQAYEELLASDASLEPWPAKLTLYQAWKKVMKREQELLKEQSSRDCKDGKCMSGGGLMWKHLFDNQQEAAALTPVEAYFALTPTLSLTNDIPSPEALVARSVDPRGALAFSCQQIDFETYTSPTAKFTMHSENTGEVLNLNPTIGRMLFSKIKEFCQPAL